MLRWTYHTKIFEYIIQRVAVQVVRMLSGLQPSSDFLRYEMAMKIHAIAISIRQRMTRHKEIKIPRPRIKFDIFWLGIKMKVVHNSYPIEEVGLCQA